MNLVRFDPFRELEAMSSRLSRLFDRSIVRSDEPDGFATWVPAVDVEETDTEYRVKADLPEVAKSDVKVGIENGVLTIEGERKQESKEENERFHRIESVYGRFLRRFSLPDDADEGAIEAENKDGSLTIRVAKRPEKQPKAREVKVS